MVFLKYLLMLGGIGMIAVAAGILAYDIYLEVKYRQALAVAGGGPLPPVPQMRWRSSLALVLMAWGPDSVGAWHCGCAQRHGGSSG